MCGIPRPPMPMNNMFPPMGAQRGAPLFRPSTNGDTLPIMGIVTQQPPPPAPVVAAVPPVETETETVSEPAVSSVKVPTGPPPSATCVDQHMSVWTEHKSKDGRTYYYNQKAEQEYLTNHSLVSFCVCMCT
eukprot:GHVR01009559.1.p2 GENE.GHVR01009559.1~~GHVR01009559.1.p2  ORF type:complete len:131 (-),score=33.72 GHVR01009559.1:164-556(-)